MAMKQQILKYACLVALACLIVLMGQARVINIDVDRIKGDLTMQLRDQCSRAGYNDTVVMNFGKGTYTIVGTIRLQCHTVIKGAGSDLSTILLDKGSDRSGFKAFTDDTYFRITGTLKNPISVSISDISFKLKEHKGIWWGEKGKELERYAVKVHHADPVTINNVDSYMADAQITNFDLHVCSNVTVTNCNLTNYNNSLTGGCLWIRGEMHNINIRDNKFYKYGKDETLGIFDRLVDNTSKYIRGKAKRTNIIVENNEFHYGDYKGSNKKDPEAYCGMLFTLMTDHKQSSDKCLTSNFHLRGNKFYISDVTTRCMYIGFDPADEHHDIYIEDNEIVNSDIGRDYAYYHKDIEIHDLSSCGDTIRVNGNKVRNRALVLNSSGNTGYMFMQTRGGIVRADGNQIVNEVTTNRKNSKPYGVQLVWCQEEGGNLTLTNNVCKGLAFVAYVGGGDGTPLFTLNARNNYFEGDTRIYSHKVKEMHLNFTGNTFVSSNATFFLQEFPPRGQVVFNYNDVTITPGRGQFMSHWGKNDTRSMRFDLLEIKGNKFKGVNSEKDLLRNITNVRKRKVSSNSINR